MHWTKKMTNETCKNKKNFFIKLLSVTNFRKYKLFDCYCHLPITLTNSSLDPDQARQNVGPDLNQNSLTLLMVFLKEFFENVNFENDQQTTIKYAKLPSMQGANIKCICCRNMPITGFCCDKNQIVGTK